VSTALQSPTARLAELVSLWDLSVRFLRIADRGLLDKTPTQTEVANYLKLLDLAVKAGQLLEPWIQVINDEALAKSGLCRAKFAAQMIELKETFLERKEIL
jgi:hypothetical protein